MAEPMDGDRDQLLTLPSAVPPAHVTLARTGRQSVRRLDSVGCDPEAGDVALAEDNGG
jgi:hypothetical protein